MFFEVKKYLEKIFCIYNLFTYLYKERAFPIMFSKGYNQIMELVSDKKKNRKFWKTVVNIIELIDILHQIKIIVSIFLICLTNYWFNKVTYIVIYLF